MKINKIMTVTAFLLVSSVGFGSCGCNKDNSYNLYSDASTKAKVVSTINADNQSNFIRFYTEKDGK